MLPPYTRESGLVVCENRFAGRGRWDAILGERPRESGRCMAWGVSVHQDHCPGPRLSRKLYGAYDCGTRPGAVEHARMRGLREVGDERIKGSMEY